MPYLSQIIGKRVLDSVGQPMGRISDLAITIEEPFGGEFPPVTLVLVKAGDAHLRLRWEMIADISSLERGNVCLLDQPRARVTVGREKEGEVYLKRDVLDKQILDVSNARMVRVNDVFLIEDKDDNLRAAGVDVSFRGLLRRVRLEHSVVPLARKFGAKMARQHIPWNQVEVLRGEGGGKIISKLPTDKLSRLHPSDLAAIVTQMNPTQRAALIETLDDETVALALEEADDEVAADVLSDLDVERAADIIEEMDPDEAADVLGEMDSPEAADAILDRLDDPEEAADIKHLLSYEEDTAGALMNTDIVLLRETFTCDEAISHLRAEDATPENSHSLFLENEDGRLTGTISLAQVVLSAGEVKLQTLVEDDLVTVDPQASVEECAKLVAKYDLMSLPVVDFNGALLGIVTVDDILDEIAPHQWNTRHRD